MEAKVPRPRGRPRKRQRLEDDNRKLNNRGKRQVLEVEPKVPISLLGRHVLKDFDDNGVFLGKIVSYDTGLYRVEYEDGDSEEMESGDLRRLIIADSYLDDELCLRRNKLDKLILKKEEKKKRNSPENKAVELPNQVKGVEAPAVTISTSEAEVEDGDSYSNSDLSESEDKRGSDFDTEAPLLQPVDLPPSSGTIGIPEEAVPHLLSVYGFLRSFSFQLYICPFELNDFVGALNFSGPNSLLDAVHVALMRVLKGHLERLSSDGSVLASKCLE